MTDIVLGPPGTGKTTTLVGRVEESLARGVEPGCIGYFSFTRKAAHEATERACDRFGLTRHDFSYFSTIHAMCFRQLGMKRADVLEGKKLQEFANYAGVKISGRWSDDGTLSGFDFGDRVLFMENLSRVRGVALREQYDEDDDSLDWSEVRRVAESLREFKRAHHLVDFTDMLHEYLRSGIRLPLKELMIDESQDLSALQWRVVARLSEGCERVTVAGDDDQAIYRWAGADVDHLIDMEGSVTVLGQSYRVPPAIQDVANSIIGRVSRRREKQWRARVGSEGAVEYTDDVMGVDVSSGKTLVLARNSYVLREQVEPALRAQGILYERGGHSSVSRSLIDAIRAWEKLRRGEQVTVSDARGTYEWMSSGRGYKRGNKSLPEMPDEDALVSIRVLKEKGGLLRDDPWFEALDKVDDEEVGYVRAVLARGERLTEKPRVTVSTIHGAKGGEADHVVLMKEMAWRSYKEIDKNPEDEMRCWYVGVTRAREKLTVVESQTRRECPWL